MAKSLDERVEGLSSELKLMREQMIAIAALLGQYTIAPRDVRTTSHSSGGGGGELRGGTLRDTYDDAFRWVAPAQDEPLPHRAQAGSDPDGTHPTLEKSSYQPSSRRSRRNRTVSSPSHRQLSRSRVCSRNMCSGSRIHACRSMHDEPHSS